MMVCLVALLRLVSLQGGFKCDVPPGSLVLRYRQRGAVSSQPIPRPVLLQQGLSPPTTRLRHCNDVVRTLSPNQIILDRYIIEKQIPCRNPSVLLARGVSSDMRVRLRFFSSMASFNEAVDIYQLLKDAEYVPELLEAVDNEPGLPPFLVFKRGSETLLSALRKRKLDIHAKDQALKQILTGLKEMHLKNVIHCNVDMDSIEYFDRDFKWRITASDFAVLEGQPLHPAMPLTKYTAPELATQCKYGSPPVADSSHDMFSYGMLAFDVLTDPQDSTGAFCNSIDTPQGWKELRKRLLHIDDGRYRQLLENLLLSYPQGRDDAATALCNLMSASRSPSIECLARDVLEIKGNVNVLKQTVDQMRVQQASGNISSEVSLRRNVSGSGLQTIGEEVPTLHDSSIPDVPLFALNVGKSYWMNVAVWPAQTMEPAVRRILSISIMQSNGIRKQLDTRQETSKGQGREAWCLLKLEDLDDERMRRPSPILADPLDKYVPLDLIIELATDNELLPPITITHRIRCCLFRKEARMILQRLWRKLRDLGRQIPQSVRTAANVTMAAINLALALVGLKP